MIFTSIWKIIRFFQSPWGLCFRSTKTFKKLSSLVFHSPEEQIWKPFNKTNFVVNSYFSFVDVVYTKIEKESHRDPEAPRIVSSRDQLRADQKQLIQMQNLGIGFLRTALADNDRGCARCQDENMLDSTKKGKIRVQVILN